MLGKFMRDLVEGVVITSRKNASDIRVYARELTAMAGITNNRIEAEPLSAKAVSSSNGRGRRTTPRQPDQAKMVRYETEIFNALRNYGNYKLVNLYHSICSLELKTHTSMVSIGAWAFFETLTSCQGRNNSISFESFSSKGKLGSLGFTEAKALCQSTDPDQHTWQYYKAPLCCGQL